MTVRDQILRFLREPKSFSASVVDPDVWLAGLTGFAQPALAAAGELPLVAAQVAAWRGMANARVALVLGPPGTGKTHLLSWMILGYIHARRAAGLPARVFVSGFTRNAIGNVLDGVANRAALYLPGAFGTHFVGAAPAAGLSPRVLHREAAYGAEGVAALADLEPESVVIGATIWSLYRLMERQEARGDGFTADLFDLICIDEASQVVLGQGLMALAGLKPDGRIVVAGDDQQLPPIRAGREIKLGQRELGGSLYAFLKSGDVPEFALDTTFRLNGPLASFPERKFYAGKYSSAVAADRIKLVEGWRDGLQSWEASVIDPDWPIAVLLHDGPPAATKNPFEAMVAARLATILADRIVGAKLNGAYQPCLWREQLAVVSPHRAQNSAIRTALNKAVGANAFVETVDRIQGKERDAVILSYCVADAEFALAEADFIFGSERLNVAATRAKTKLIVLISRKLLDAVPGEQEAMDKAEILREFVFNAAPVGDVTLRDPTGVDVGVQIRLVGFEGPPALVDFVSNDAQSSHPPETLTPALEALLEAVISVASRSVYRSATLRDLGQRMATRESLLPDLAKLHAIGLVTLGQRKGKDGSFFWVVAPLDPPRRVFPAQLEIVRSRLEEVIAQVRQSRLPPYYWSVRGRFAWMDGEGRDVLRPLLERMKDEGLIALGLSEQALTVEWTGVEETLPEPERVADAILISDDDFRVLNALEDLEASRINFGIFEAWTSIATLADGESFSRQSAAASIRRLAIAGWVLLADDDRVRSRMAELAREMRQVKQRFQRDDAAQRPYLVRSLKVELRNREKPERRDRLDRTFSIAGEGLADEHQAALNGLSNALAVHWTADARLAGFQTRSIVALSQAWRGGPHDAFVIAADTGSGKTEAAALPLIAAAAADALRGIRGTRVIMTYPRVRLAANQAQRLAGYLAALAQQAGMPTITLGLQVAQVPERLSALSERDVAAGWSSLGSGKLAFPLFACPKCGGDLLLEESAGIEGADELSCISCNWRYGGWVGSKQRIRVQPPALFLPTTDSLHQWLHDARYGRLFGDDREFAPPRALLADEIHLYSHVHGAQVGFALRRLTARAAINDSPARKMLTIGMSATLGDPARAWERLIGREGVVLLTPHAEEKTLNPRGREYFYFVQPEVESRGKDVAGNSTTIQAVMALAHGMRRRTGVEGGFRTLVFLDSVDKLRRLHAAYDDAESQKNLAALRTRRYPDDPVTGALRNECCGRPFGCDVFRDGECWYFGATDNHQVGAGGRCRPGQALRVAPQPIFSGTAGKVETTIKASDVIFTTSSLEVGYDDPDISFVYQHYAPRNLASFIQRKGRGGRGADDRPITGVTLSLYNSRDTWWFRKPHEMISPEGFDTPLNPNNHFVRRGQLLSTILDALARRYRRTGQPADLRRPSLDAFAEAEGLVAKVFGANSWLEFDEPSLSAFWAKACATIKAGRPLRFFSDFRNEMEWAPTLLFETINLPRVTVHAGSESERSEDVAQSLIMAAPGNASRRFSDKEVYWRPPTNGLAPWLAREDYGDRLFLRPFGDNPNAWLTQLPDNVRPSLANLSPDYFRPNRMTLEILGRRHGTGWVSDWVVPDPMTPSVERIPGDDHRLERVRDDARGFLRGFPIIKASADRARSLSCAGISTWVERVDAFLGDGMGGRETGLALAQVYWGADAELNLEGPPTRSAVFAQTFTAPNDNRPLLHGYHVQTEGVQFVVKLERLKAFAAAEAVRLKSDGPSHEWHKAQMLRFLVEAGAQAVGINAFDARRAAELMVSAAAAPQLWKRLLHLKRFWSGPSLGQLFEDTRRELLSHHPLLSADRVERVATSLSVPAFQGVFQDAVAALEDTERFLAYLESATMHALANRLKESFLRIGTGDERQVVMHVRLPIQFSQNSEPTITICEAGSFGDGTTRSFVDRFDESVAHWFDGFIGECPNAHEDDAVASLLNHSERHDEWRALDPSDPAALRSLASEIGLAPGEAMPAAALRILFDHERVGLEDFALYDIAVAVEAVDRRLMSQLSRAPTVWELTSAAVETAKREPGSATGKLLRAYGGIEGSVQDESLSAEGRLGEQVFRLHARLCVDGCPACVHQTGDLMSDGLVEASTSRNLLSRFICGF